MKADSIEQALELNGVAVQANVAAFRWGRALIAAPAAVASAIAKSARKKSVGPVVDPRTVQKLDGSNVTGELRRILEVRVPDLVAYQDVKYADRYLDIVREVLIAERGVVGVSSTALAEEVAFNLYKLMAYKDEYEVARLHLDTAFEERIADELGATGRVYFHLHPPILRAMGLKRKLRLGLSARPSFLVLAAGKRLRGTALDPFGQMHVRKVERALIDEYIAAVRGMLERLSSENHDIACRVAALPDMVRGYELIKLDNVSRYRAELTELLGMFDA